MKTILIAAVSPDLVIGRDGGLPWHVPEDLKHFMETTVGHPCIMGRRTYESFPKRPLPRRPNLVLTRNPDYELAEGVLRFDGLPAALDHCRAAGHDRAFVCGGESVYRQALPDADEMVLTHLPDRVEGDTYFPTFEAAAWDRVDEIRESGLHISRYRRRISS